MEGIVFKRPSDMPLYPGRVATSPRRRIIVHTDYGMQLDPQVVSWKGKNILVGDFELFTLVIKDWMKRYSWTKEQALDAFFEMI